jgi:hypothetical protein
MRDTDISILLFGKESFASVQDRYMPIVDIYDVTNKRNYE